METGQVAEGLKAINSWVEHNPADTQAWLYKGFLEAKMNHPEEALKAFDKLIELQPEKEGNYVGRGQMLYALGRYETSDQPRSFI
jgi:tetratricopeptide (TPR) repeat protein